jgi:LysM repeat protein
VPNCAKGVFSMKIWSVFSFVLILHLTLIGLFLIQPGCQSRTGPAPDPSITATSGALESPMRSGPGERALDPAFNAGMTSGAPAAPSGSLAAPRRPGEPVRSEIDTSGMEPVLNPVVTTIDVQESGRLYTVEPGDSLSRIAAREGVSLNALMESNGLNKQSVIYVGQSLRIPAASAASEPLSVESEHAGLRVTVQAGDSLSSIARRNGTTVAALKSANALRSDTIYVGQELLVPGNGATPPSMSGSRSPRPSGTLGYTVVPGDTVSGIARRYGISTRELMAANGMTDPNKVFVGQQLVIPGQDEVSTGTPEPVPSVPVTAPVNPAESQWQAPQRPSAEPVEAEPEDPILLLEALEDEDLPFVEVETVEETPGS